ncbi:MAG: sensor histidine kinase, partial [Brasilonema sp.]
CLPLLQFALTELWEQRDNQKHQLTVEQYRAMGGVIGALDLHAENIYHSFTQKEQEWIKQIFLKLVRTGEGEKDTRQQQPKAKLLAIGGENEIGFVLDELIQERLLVSGQENLHREAWVDLAHEALMEGWKRFVQWGQENRELRRLIDRVEDALQEWQKQPKNENLIMGGLLAQVREKWEEIKPDLDAVAKEFYQKSIAFEEQQQQLIEAASNAKGQFLANISHELRTPLNAIIGLSQILRDDALNTSLSEDFIEDLESINGAGKHLLTLINDILDLSKIAAGKMSFYPEAFHLATLINNVVLTVKPLVEKNGNVLEVDFDEKLAIMYTDQTKLRQVLYNLLSNAAKFTTNGRVALIVKKETPDLNGNYAPESITFTVEDTGVGMSYHQQQQLFQPFTQGDASTTKKYGGTGLGLAISRHFCHLMGGEIFVRSETGVGSIFTVRLPLNVTE